MLLNILRNYFCPTPSQRQISTTKEYWEFRKELAKQGLKSELVESRQGFHKETTYQANGVISRRTIHSIDYLIEKSRETAGN
ncbi:MAG: hypothetical protein OQK82_05890 [Candidatus Pacearchaeota archaeon]|nr:hypothetical protein [Candidatus Pacearchaeota archaeon]